MLEYIALGLLIFVIIVAFYGIIVIHDIPYKIAKKRNHPHADSLHAASWVSLLTLHALWPFLWIWATLWREDRGWGFRKVEIEQQNLHEQVNQLSVKVNQLQQQVMKLQKAQHQASNQVKEVTHTENNTLPETIDKADEV